MQTNLASWIKNTPEGKDADAILRKCVHCGFCTATCPTYQLLGDELDGPRGRIYLVKQVLEGVEPTAKTQSHLDRCLTCRSCETTCPSGVEYGRLVDIGKKMVDDKVGRSVFEGLKRGAMAAVLSRGALFAPLVALGRLVKPVLPSALAAKVPAPARDPGAWPAPRHARRMIALAGCVQPSLAPDTNAAAARVLDRLGISLVEAPSAGCCGALRYHLDRQADGLDDMRRVIDAWWPLVEAKGSARAEAIVMTASGCGAMVREYGHLLARDPIYADKARRISELALDLVEVLWNETERGALTAASLRPASGKVAFHAPCTLQHGQKLKGLPERLLARLGFELTPVPDSHLCCGSAGTYSILQPDLSNRLRVNKLEALGSGEPAMILTANIGCQMHLDAAADRPVRHWITELEARLG